MVVTRADVAKAAGVSPSTVSYVLSGDRPTSQATKQKVLSAIKKLGYVPNVTAGDLAARSMRTIGLHMFAQSFGMDAVAAQYINGMQQQAEEIGSSLIIPVLGQTSPESFRKFLRSAVVHALIFMDTALNDYREEIIMEEKFPAVILGRTGRERGLPYVESDFEAMGGRSVEFVADYGHRNVLALTRSDHRGDLERIVHSTMSGLRLAAKQRGVEVVECHVPSHVSQAPAVMRMLMEPDAPTVILGENIEVAQAVAVMAKERGMKIGQDLSIVTIGGASSRLNDQGAVFTEVSTDRNYMGRLCVQKLEEVYFKGAYDQVESVYVSPQVVDRGSVARLG